MQALLFALVLICLHATLADVGRTSVSPVEKVIELMEHLTATVTEEGKNEARQYDQFACFCKDQADAKAKAIEANKELEERLAATIKELAAEIAQLETEVPALAKKIDQLSKQTEDLVAAREKQHADYVKAELDISEAIEACAAAISVLKDAKTNIKAGGGKVDLVQVLQAAKRLVAPTAAGERSQLVLALLSAREVPASPEKTLKFEFQSNDILETIKDLMRQFKEDKKELDDTEFESKSAFEKEKLGLDHQKDLAQKDKEQKEQLIETKTEEEEKTKQDHQATVAALRADEGFLEELTTTCEKKAEAWDERSKTRAAELTAIAEAMEVLKAVALKNYRPAKLAALLQQKSSEVRPGPLSFLQTSEAMRRSIVVRHIRAELLTAADRLHSPSLASIATAIGAANDKFAKVIGLIEELIAKLEKQATEEAELKTICDDHLKEIEETEAKAKKDIKDSESAIALDEAEKENAENALRELTQQIVELKKALLKAKEMRAKEEAANSKAVADASAGVEAVKLAQSILKNFYGDFLQFGAAAPSPAAADSQGNTVADLAPKTFGGEYKGKKAESGGVVAMLDVILSDFERTLSETKEAETSAAKEFEEFQTHCEEDEEAKTKEREEKKTKIANLADALMEHRDTVKTSKVALKANREELEKLKAMCVFGQDTYDVRVARREQEIEALREAYKMLDAYQP